jgi:hypothetical protein
LKTDLLQNFALNLFALRAANLKNTSKMRRLVALQILQKTNICALLPTNKGRTPRKTTAESC